MTDVPTVGQLVADLKRRVQPVGKDRQADTGLYGYAYRGVDDILDQIGRLTTEFGLTIEPIGVSETQGDTGDWLVRMSYVWWGPAGDSQPCATNIAGVARNLVAAQQFAYRVALTQGLCIPLGLDEERHHPSSSLSGSQGREERRGPPKHTATLVPDGPAPGGPTEALVAKLPGGGWGARWHDPTAEKGTVRTCTVRTKAGKPRGEGAHRVVAGPYEDGMVVGEPVADAEPAAVEPPPPDGGGTVAREAFLSSAQSVARKRLGEAQCDSESLGEYVALAAERAVAVWPGDADSVSVDEARRLRDVVCDEVLAAHSENEDPF